MQSFIQLPSDSLSLSATRKRVMLLWFSLLMLLVAAPAYAVPPTITVLGANPAQVVEGDAYVDAGATANDAEDGNLTASIVVDNPVDTSIPGAYTVTYTVTDS